MQIPSELPQNNETDNNTDNNEIELTTDDKEQEEILTEEQEEEIQRILEIEIINQRKRNSRGMAIVENSFEIKEPFYKQSNQFIEEEDEEDFDNEYNEYEQPDQIKQWPHLCIEKEGEDECEVCILVSNKLDKLSSIENKCKHNTTEDNCIQCKQRFELKNYMNEEKVTEAHQQFKLWQEEEDKNESTISNLPLLNEETKEEKELDLEEGEETSQTINLQTEINEVTQTPNPYPEFTEIINHISRIKTQEMDEKQRKWTEITGYTNMTNTKMIK